jgi:hypothetical protein
VMAEATGLQTKVTNRCDEIRIQDAN